MTIPTHADEAGCIQPDRMLIVGEKLGQTYIASDPTKRIVKGTFLYVTDIEKKDDKITVTGYDLKYLFALRVTLFQKKNRTREHTAITSQVARPFHVSQTLSTTIS